MLLRVRTRHKINLADGSSRSGRQGLYGLVLELLDVVYQRLHLDTGVGLALQVVVHQIVHRVRDEIGDERIHFLLGVVGGEGIHDGGIHLLGRGVAGESRIDGGGDGSVGLRAGVVAREVYGRTAYLLPAVGGHFFLGSSQGDILILDVVGFGIHGRHQIDDTNGLSRSSWQLGHTLIAELLDSSDQRIHLSLGEGLALQVVVHEIVHAGGDEVGDERIYFLLGVVGFEGGGNQLVHLCRGRVVGQCGSDGTHDGGIHLHGCRVGSECRVQGGSDGRVGLSLRVVVGEVDGRGAYLLP